jgi:hypothetical protein
MKLYYNFPPKNVNKIFMKFHETFFHEKKFRQFFMKFHEIFHEKIFFNYNFYNSDLEWGED